MKYILANKKSYTSARLLATHLGLKVTSNPEVIKRKNGELSLRYGCSLNFSGNNNDVFNTPESIRTVSDSLRFQDSCAKFGFKTSQYIHPATVVLNNLVFPLLLRNKYHSRGLDIIYVETLEELKTIDLRNKFIVPFVDVDSELGVHIINFQIVKIFKKVAVSLDSHPFIRNLDHGYHFKVVKNIETNFKIVQELSIELFKSLGLMFGRADIGFNSGKKDYIIWEVNSAPGLNTNTAKLYAEKLIQVIK